jgi:ABC-type amino acid transport substrate-binding protein
VFSKIDSSNALAAAFDQALSEMTADGTIKRFREKYFGITNNK